jgi:hypothetical protein
MPGKIMQGTPEGGGSLGNGQLHSRPLPRRRMNQRPQAFPTLLHCPDSSQHHNPPDYLTDRMMRDNQPQLCARRSTASFSKRCKSFFTGRVLISDLQQCWPLVSSSTVGAQVPRAQE